MLGSHSGFCEIALIFIDIVQVIGLCFGEWLVVCRSFFWLTRHHRDVV